MGTDRIQVADVIPSSAADIYEAWLDAEKHAAMTGGRATSDGRSVGSRFTAWDDYIFGEHLDLEPNRRIVQAWSTSEFPPGSPPSRVEVLLEEIGDGTQVTIVHTDIPEGQGPSYEGGWQTFYFTPMKRHFGVKALGEAQVLSQRSERLAATAALEKKAEAATKKAAAKAKAAPLKVAAKPKAIVGAKKAKPAAKKKAKPAAKKKVTTKKAKPLAKKKVAAKKAKPPAKKRAKPPAKKKAKPPAKKKAKPPAKKRAKPAAKKKLTKRQ